MTKQQLTRLRFLLLKMTDHVREWQPGERNFLANMGEVGKYLTAVAAAPDKWGVK